MVGHFPPPVHGMAVAFDALAGLIEHHGRVVRLPTSPSRMDRSATYHVIRVVRVLRAILGLVRERRTSRAAIMSVDAGLGIVYTLTTAVVARALGYRIFLQHHSYAHLNRRSRRMSILVRCVGPATHLCLCPAMTALMRRRYPRASDVRTIPGSYAITEAQGDQVSPLSRGVPETLRIGHFGNLSMNKGLEVATETFEAAIAAGIPAVLVLAGPAVGRAEEAFIRDATARRPDRIQHVGPVYGQAREELLRSLDVLLFPSRYSHEASPLSFWECLNLGVPAIAFRAGCLTQAATGEGAVVLEPDVPFVEEAVRVLAELHNDPGVLAQRRVAARRAAASSIRAGLVAVDDLIRALSTLRV